MTGVASEGAAENADARSVERVEREDKIARLGGAAKFCKLVTATGREAIVAEFASRGLDGAGLTALGNDAEALANAGKNVRIGAEATADEAAAVAAQATRWNAVKDLVRSACASDNALVSKLREC